MIYFTCSTRSRFSLTASKNFHFIKCLLFFRKRHVFIGTKSNHCLFMSLVKIGFVKVVTRISLRWICQIWYMDFSEFLHWFVKICKWALSKLINGSLLEVVTWFCQSCKMDYLKFLNSRCWMSQSTQCLGSDILTVFLLLWLRIA